MFVSPTSQVFSLTRGWHTGTHCREICGRSLSQRSRPLKSCQFKGQSHQPTIEKYWNFVVKPTVKGQKRLLVKSQSEISAGQDFDPGCRSPYSAYLRDTPLIEWTPVQWNVLLPLMLVTLLRLLTILISCNCQPWSKFSESDSLNF